MPGDPFYRCGLTQIWKIPRQNLAGKWAHLSPKSFKAIRENISTLNRNRRKTYRMSGRVFRRLRKALRIWGDKMSPGL